MLSISRKTLDVDSDERCPCVATVGRSVAYEETKSDRAVVELQSLSRAPFARFGKRPSGFGCLEDTAALPFTTSRSIAARASALAVGRAVMGRDLGMTNVLKPSAAIVAQAKSLAFRGTASLFNAFAVATSSLFSPSSGSFGALAARLMCIMSRKSTRSARAMRPAPQPSSGAVKLTKEAWCKSYDENIEVTEDDEAALACLLCRGLVMSGCTGRVFFRKVERE